MTAMFTYEDSAIHIGISTSGSSLTLVEVNSAKAVMAFINNVVTYCHHCSYHIGLDIAWSAGEHS
jgi:hypothetical protein